MQFLLLSIVCSVSVGVLFKLLRKYQPHLPQVIAWNYVCAIVLCLLFFKPKLPSVDAGAPWGVYLALGLLLPVIFLVLAASIRHMGIVKTDAAQRMALCIPLLAAWLLFGEIFDSWKIIGTAIGLPALVMILWKKSNQTENKWLYPAVVMLGFGIIDILFKKVALHTNIPYTDSLFVIFLQALAISSCIVVYEIIVKKSKMRFRNIGFGLLLGALNFGNIYFYLHAHRAFSNNPSTVFTVMNIGVIVLGSLIGVIAFREKLTKLNYAGLVLAIVAILLIALPHLND